MCFHVINGSGTANLSELQCSELHYSELHIYKSVSQASTSGAAQLSHFFKNKIENVHFFNSTPNPANVSSQFSYYSLYLWL